MHSSGIVKTSLVFCIGLFICAGARAGECPWPLAKDYSGFGEDQPIKDYIKKLGVTSNSREVGDFRKQLRDRVAEDEKIIASGVKGDRYEKAKAEIDRYEFFLGSLMRVLDFKFNGKVEVGKDKTHVDFEYAQLDIPTSNVRVAAYAGDKKMYFFQYGDRVFLEGKDMEEINQQVRQMFYIYYFLDGLTDQKYLKYRAIAITCFNNTRQAMANNKLENVDYHPMPKAGKLNSLAPKALALAKKSSSYADAIDVVIDANDWTIERNKLGIIQRRKVGAWVIKQMKYCKRAYRCQFAEPFRGNGYGELILYGIGGGQFNIK